MKDMINKATIPRLSNGGDTIHVDGYSIVYDREKEVYTVNLYKTEMELVITESEVEEWCGETLETWEGLIEKRCNGLLRVFFKWVHV